MVTGNTQQFMLFNRKAAVVEKDVEEQYEHFCHIN